jgi:hypothetical protein
MLKKKGRFEPLAWEEYSLNNYLSRVERRVFILPILMHFGIVLWAVPDLLALRAPATEGKSHVGVLQASRLYSSYLHSL